MKQVIISRQAYGKIFLHAAKYFDGVVLGYVVGQQSEGKVDVSDLLSVCHSNPAGPILDIAGDLAEKLFQDKVVGIYYGIDGTSNAVVPENIIRIIDGVAKLVGGECVVVRVRNDLMSSKQHHFVEATTSKKAACKVSVADSMDFLSSLLDALLIQKISVGYSDFEDHLNSSAEVSVVNKGAADFQNAIATNFIQHYVPNK